MKVKKTSQAFCQSWYEGKSDTLKDCTCGKCRVAHHVKPWNGKEPVVIDEHFDNPSKTWNGDAPKSYPTTSDIGELMREFGYEWSNEAQTYYHTWEYTHISRKAAEGIYKVLIGNKPYYPIGVKKVSRI